MAKQPGDKKEKDKTKSALKADKKRLDKTDPQENMEGPVSSFMKEAGENFDSKKTQQQADKEKNEKM